LPLAIFNLKHRTPHLVAPLLSGEEITASESSMTFLAMPCDNFLDVFHSFRIMNMLISLWPAEKFPSQLNFSLGISLPGTI
jgi:hypothetical protein